jgi:hypothetical protein
MEGLDGIGPETSFCAPFSRSRSWGFRRSVRRTRGVYKRPIRFSISVRLRPAWVTMTASSWPVAIQQSLKCGEQCCEQVTDSRRLNCLILRPNFPKNDRCLAPQLCCAGLGRSMGYRDRQVIFSCFFNRRSGINMSSCVSPAAYCKSAYCTGIWWWR